MLHIAIVDDNPSDIAIIKEYLTGYFKKRAGSSPIDYTLSAFQDGFSFLSSFSCAAYDLVFLDIYMPRMTGIDVARRMRLVDDGVKIVFLTTSKEHALESYSVFASAYILKPIAENQALFVSALNRLLPDEMMSGRKLTVHLAGQSTLEIPFARILSVDCNNTRNAVVHLEGKDIPTQNTYQELSTLLATDERFLECYHRLTINMDYVTSMEEDLFHLKGNHTAPISRRKKKEVKQGYLQYLLDK